MATGGNSQTLAHRIFDDEIDEEKQITGRGRGRGSHRSGRRPRGRAPSRGRPVSAENGAQNVYKSNVPTERGRYGYRANRGGRGPFLGQHHQHSICVSRETDSDVLSGVDKEEQSVPKAPREQREMRFCKLKELIKDENSDEVFLELSQSRSGFIELVDKSFDFKDNALYILKTLVIATKSSISSNLREFLERLYPLLIPKLSTLLSKVQLKDRNTNFIWNNPQQMGSFLNDISEFLQALMSTLPDTLPACNTVIIVLKSIPRTFPGLNFGTASLEEVFSLVKTEHERLADTDHARKNPVFKTVEHDVAPPNNFREISVFPKLDDIHLNELPFLRANKTKGKYDSVDTYLDIQFRLLREDYVQPLRQGIHEYRACIQEGVSVNRLRNVRIYPNVQILQPVCSGQGINHVIQFDNSHLSRVNWASSRRLLYGSLVCLSVDDFDTVHYATITDRDATKLKEGTLVVHFENIGDGILDYPGNQSFVMAETTAYFEAYRYVLEGLQKMPETMPMMRYIIDCETVIKPPAYLLGHGGPNYNFGPLLKEPTGVDEYPVLNTRRWPTFSELGLDSSQYNALQTAITKEFAIIQGPPGTGKTFVGLKITELLLNNSMFWKSKTEKSPILVVCYTNHALDQFLEGIAKICDQNGIIRIGGRCKNDNLVPFILRNVKARIRKQQERSFKLMQNEKDCRGRLRDSERKIEEISAKIKRTASQILSFKALEPFMNENHAKEFDMMIRKKHVDENTCLQTWLAFQPFGNQISVDAQTNIKQTWIQFILDEVQPIPKSELNEIDDFGNKDLFRKAEIYKTMHMECMENFNATLARDRCSRLFTYEGLEKGLMDPVTKIKLKTITTNMRVRVPKKKVVDVWLCVNKINEIIEALEHFQGHIDSEDIDNNDELDDDDLEEDRVLDDLKDDFQFDYRTDDFELRRDKREAKKLNNEEWISVFNQQKNAQRVRAMLNKAMPISEDNVKTIKSVRVLENGRRLDLYVFWLQKHRAALKNDVKKYENQFRTATESLQEVRDMETIHILKESVIMGMTTTGAAKYRKILQKVKPQIILVEEAAEVLEAHIITTLNDNCKHLILIGDHKQLRPSTTVYELAKKYEMDISLFERMVRNNVPCVTLEEQHRMRPEISKLLRREKLYPQLRDHESVLRYERVKGVDVNIQFISHEEGEYCSGDSTSYSNPHEARYISALCKYFINQGYTKEQITILTPYMGQVLLLRNEMPKSLFEGVRITAVDNYQGEENDIILLSLVRSSLEGNARKRNPIGFVGIENRICVALSRAKHGLFVVGNFKLLERSSVLWDEIIAEMKESNSVKSHLTLRCGNHPEMCTLASCAQDFDNVPNGGCNKPCGSQLSCGHICTRACHVVDILHKFVTCYKPCEKINPSCILGHKCTKKCYQYCGNCEIKVEKEIPMCHHKAKLPCYMDPFKWECSEICKVILPCGHSCDQKCHKCHSEAHNQKCEKKVTRTLPCGHKMELQCLIEISTVDCPVDCMAVHECGHSCSGKCGSCFGGKIHKKCRGTCGKVLPCGHKCTFPCSEEHCPPCSRNCNRKCGHRFECKTKCSQPCNPCTDKCLYQCKHGKCENDCHERCSMNPCDQKCRKTLACQHTCRGLCGENCVCIVCNNDLVRNESETDFDEDTIFFQLQDCNCILKVGYLDMSFTTQAISERRDLALHCPFSLCEKLVETDSRRYSTRIKEASQAIIDANKRMQSQECNVKEVMKNVTKKLDLLKSNGFIGNEQYTKFQKQIVSRNASTLSVLEKRLDKLQELAKIEQIIETAEDNSLIDSMSVDGVLGTGIIRSVILGDKLNTTKQFWAEVSREISRLQICVKFCLLKYHLYGKKGKTIDQALDLSFTAISSTGFGHDLLVELKSFSSRLHLSVSGNSLSELDINVSVYKLKSALQLCELQAPSKMAHKETRTVKKIKYVERPTEAKFVPDEGYAAKPVEH